MPMTPTATERNTAAIGHLVSIPFPIWGPVIFYFLHRKSSRFVSLHAVNILIGGLIQSMLLATALVVSALISLGQFLQNPQFTWDLLWAILVKAAVVWVILGVIYVVDVVKSILSASRAQKGEWKPRGISGRMAERLVLRFDRPELT